MADIDLIITNLKNYEKSIKPKLLKNLAIEAERSVLRNFIEQGRPDKWKKKLFDDGRAILTGKTGHLQRKTSPKIFPAESRVSIGNTLPYGKIQNEGGKIKVSSKMRKFFWAMFFQNSVKSVGKNGKTVHTPTPRGIIWRNMALSKKGFIEIPARRYAVIPASDFGKIKTNLQNVINTFNNI